MKTGGRGVRAPSGPFRRTLRGRITIGAGFLLGAIAVFISWYVPLRIETEALDLTAERATSIVSMTAYSVAAPLVFEDDRAIQEVFAGARSDQDVLYIVLTDADGRIVAAFDFEAAERAGWSSGPTDAVTSADAAFRVEAEVVTPGGPAGKVYLGISLADLRTRSAEARRHIALISFLLFAIGALGADVLATVATRPVRRIVATVDAVSGGDFQRRTGLEPRDEIGFLGHAFDEMVGRLGEAYEALRSANLDLEARVEERTEALQHEVDERRRAEVALRESERHFRAIFQFSAVGIAIISPEGELDDLNGALRRMLGIPDDSPAGDGLREMVHPEDREALDGLLRQARAGGEARPTELRWIRPDGTTVWARGVASVVLGAEDAPDFGFVMMQDVTGQKALEDQLRQSQKLEAVGQLAGGVAHDFNNLLTTINGLAEMALSEHGDDPDLASDLTEIRKAGERAATLTAQLLTFSRRQILRPEEVDVVDAVRDMASMLQRLTGTAIRLELELAGDTEGIRADPGQIAQVVMNLVVNARDAMPNGGLLRIATRNVTLEPREADRLGGLRSGRYVLLEVRDTGHGMDQATRERAFEPFFTSKAQGKGTGLGLSTVYGIVRQSEGGIRLDSEPGAGTTFSLYFPSIGSAPAARAAKPAEEPDAGAGTILLVEDEEAVRSVIGRILRKSGYVVLEAHDGEHALEMFRTHGSGVDLIVTDVVMPNMSGPQLVRAVSHDYPEMPVLYVSGFTQDEVLEGVHGTNRSGEAPARRIAFMQKPMQPIALTRKVEELLAESRARA